MEELEIEPVEFIKEVGSNIYEQEIKLFPTLEDLVNLENADSFEISS